MKLVGDPDGISALKELVDAHREYMKFLIAEAQSNADHTAAFRGNDGSKWLLVMHLQNGDLEVKRAEG